MASFFIDTPELFKNIAQLDCAGKYFDFHNEYVCTNLFLNQKCLTLNLIHSITGANISLIFNGISITKFDFPFKDAIEPGLTLDNVYRGRYELDNNLFEFDYNNRSYYYLEFYEGFKIEFFSTSLQLQTGDENNQI